MRLATLPLLLLAFTVPLAAQTAPMGPPGKADPARVTAGSYTVDTGHTQVLWQLNHLGFTKYDGQFGGVTGTLQMDPAKPAGARVSVTIPISGLSTTVAALTTHLGTPDFFDSAKYPMATFTSTSVTANGMNAKIAGDLTLHGVTRPVVLDAHFVGAGPGMRAPNALNVGFEATTRIKRSDFGMKFGLPAIGDDIDLRINAAFVKA